MRPAHRSTRLLAMIAIATALASMTVGHAALADEVALPNGSTEATAAPSTPARGVTMNKVQAQFGAPTERHAAIGNPPITRWDYPGFSVFFEHDHVIHAVVR